MHIQCSKCSGIYYFGDHESCPECKDPISEQVPGGKVFLAWMLWSPVVVTCILLSNLCCRAMGVGFAFSIVVGPIIGALVGFIGANVHMAILRRHDKT